MFSLGKGQGIPALSAKTLAREVSSSLDFTKSSRVVTLEFLGKT